MDPKPMSARTCYAPATSAPYVIAFWQGWWILYDVERPGRWHELGSYVDQESAEAEVERLLRRDQ